jgi:methionyl-tRNA synthetase
MIEKYCAGAMPKGGRELADSLAPWRVEEKIRQIRALYEQYQFTRVLEEIWRLITDVDLLISEQKPWALAEDSSKREQLETVLWIAADTLRAVAVLAHPVIPSATEKLWRALGQGGSVGEQRIDALEFGLLRPGAKIAKAESLFPRIEKQEAIERMEAMESEPQKPTAAPVTSTTASTGSGAAAAQTAPEKIAIEDFAKVEMRVGQIKTAERIVGADKLLKLTVDIGSEVRQICAGIAKFYEPEALVGRKVVVVVNLAPRKLRGVESNGMIVAASVGPEGRPVLAAFTEDVEVGARLK